MNFFTFGGVKTDAQSQGGQGPLTEDKQEEERLETAMFGDQVDVDADMGEESQDEENAPVKI